MELLLMEANRELRHPRPRRERSDWRVSGIHSGTVENLEPTRMPCLPHSPGSGLKPGLDRRDFFGVPAWIPDTLRSLRSLTRSRMTTVGASRPISTAGVDTNTDMAPVLRWRRHGADCRCWYAALPAGGNVSERNAFQRVAASVKNENALVHFVETRRNITVFRRVEDEGRSYFLSERGWSSD